MKRKIATYFLLLFFALQGNTQVKLTVNVPQNGVILISPDATDKQVLTVDNNTFYRWDLRTGRCMQQMKVAAYINKIKLSIDKKYFITSEDSASHIFIGIYDASNFAQLALISTDSLLSTKKDEFYSLRKIENFCFDTQSGWIGAVTYDNVIFYNLLTKQSGVAKIPDASALTSISPLGNQWLVAGQNYTKQKHCIWSVTPGKIITPVPWIDITKEDGITEMIQDPKEKYILAIIHNNKAGLLKADNKQIHWLSTPKDFNYWTEGDNYQYVWNENDQAFYITTEYGVYSYKPSQTKFTEVLLNNYDLHTKKFFLPYDIKKGLYLEKNHQNISSLFVRDYIVTSIDTAFFDGHVVTFGSSQLINFSQIRKAGQSKYLLTNYNYAAVIDLNTLKAQSLQTDITWEFLSDREFQFFPGSGTFGESMYKHSDDNNKITLAIKEIDLENLWDTTEVMTILAEDDDLRPPSVYSGFTGDSLYIIDAVGRKAYIYDRIKKNLLQSLSLPENLTKYWPLPSNRFTALPGGDFLYAGDKMIHYNLEKRSYKIVDTTVQNNIHFLAFDTFYNRQLYATQQQQLPYHYQVRSYSIATGDTSVLLDGDDAYNILMINSIHYKGMPCWIAGIRGGEVQVRTRDLKEVLYSFYVEKNTGISDMAVDEEKQQLIILLSDNSVRIIDMSNFNPVARLYFSNLGRAFYTVAFDNNNNYFMPSRQTGVINWVYKGKAYDFSVFDKYFNKPALLLQELKSKDTAYIRLLQKAYETRQKRLTHNLSISQIEQLPLCIINEKAVPFSTDSATVVIPFHIKAGKNAAVRFQVYVNNVPILYTSKGLFKTPLSAGKDTSFSMSIILSPDRSNQVKIQAFDDGNNASLPAEINIYRRKINQYNSSKIYYLGYGCSAYKEDNYHLKYATKDVKDIAKMFKDKVESRNVGGMLAITDSLVTLNNIVNGFAWLADHASTDDIVIISFSGHGMTGKDGKFHFMLYDTDFSNPEKTSLPFEVVFEMLKILPCRNKLVLIDACESGDFDPDGNILKIKPATTAIVNGKGIKLNSQPRKGSDSHLEIMKEYFSDLSTESGATIIAASAGNSNAYENDEWKNGIFSFCFMKGLFSFDADKNKDGEISISELQTYMSYTVEEMTNGDQQPSTRNIDLRNDWIIMKKNNINNRRK